MRYVIYVKNTMTALQPSPDRKGIRGGVIMYVSSPSEALKNRKLVSATLTEEINKIASFQFTIGKDNPAYDEIQGRNTHVWIYEYDINSQTISNSPNVIFMGHVVDIVESIDRSGIISKSVTCADVMDFLNESILDRDKYKCQDDGVQPQGVRVYNSVLDYFPRIFEEHNAKISYVQTTGHFQDAKQISFTLQKDHDGNPYVTNYYVGYVYVQDWQRSFEKFVDWCNRWGYEWRVDPYIVDGEYKYTVTLTNKDHRNRDVIANSARVIEYPDLEYGVNIVELSVHKDTTEYYTRLFPIGAVDEEAADGTRTFLHVATGDTGNYHRSNRFYCVDNESGIQNDGVCCGLAYYDDVTTENYLDLRGKMYLQYDARAKIQYSGKFIDLAGDSGDGAKWRYYLGDYHTLKHPLLGINEDVRIVYLKRNILNPWDVEMKLGDIFLNNQEQKRMRAKETKGMTDDIYRVCSSLRNT